MDKRHISRVVALIFLLHFPAIVFATNYTLTLVPQGPGSIAANPNNTTFPQGVVVTITATPNANCFFTGWSGDTNGTVNPLNVMMNSSLVITGNFSASAQYTLNLVTNGQGTIALSPPGGVYASNSTVTLTATPASGWLFNAWTGSTNSTANPLTVAVTNNMSLTGTFVQVPTFDVEPQTISNSTGSTVSFNSHSAGTAPLTYQWYYNGALLAGSTNATLSLTNIQPVNAGNYWVVATNNYGGATSTTASLVLTNLGGSTNAVNICTEANLRSALAAGGWVSIHCNGSFNLTSTLNITNNVTLDASGFNATINGGNAIRLAYVSSSGTLTASNVIFANGTSTNFNNGTNYTDGGAIYNNGGHVNLVACLLTNNQAIYQVNPYPLTGSRGGAIFNKGGTVALFGCSLSNNAALGGFVSTFMAGCGIGGAIYTTNGTVTVLNSMFSSNQCISYAGSGSYGGAIYQASGTLTINNVLFNQNVAAGANSGSDPQLPSAAPAYGGALAIGSGSASVNQCQFLQNTVQGGYLLRSVAPGTGGAIYNGGSLTMDYSTLAGNQGFSGYNQDNHATVVTMAGGAIFNSNVLVLNHSCIFSNQLQGALGGYIGSSGMQIPGGDSRGGGIYNAGRLYATNCTIALNDVMSGSGVQIQFSPVYTPNGNAFGGGIYNTLNSTSVLMNVTIASNLCIAGGYGLPPTNGFSAGDQVVNSNGVVYLRNSLLAYAGTNGNAYGSPITDGGYNISSDGSANLFGGFSYNFTDPQLGPLADNGGPTLTMALLAISPAIDNGNSLKVPNTDQRGFVRPFGSGVDMGAFEYGSFISPQFHLTMGSGSVSLNFQAGPSSYTYHLLYSTNLTAWNNLETDGPFSGNTNVTRNFATPTGNRCFYHLIVQ